MKADNVWWSMSIRYSYLVQFDQFVAQGKVLHNYANILKLLLRLRQRCNHPFLVMSRGETNPNSANPSQVPSRAYIEEVVDGIRRGDNTECPICLESADDPVLTPLHTECAGNAFSLAGELLLLDSAQFAATY